MHFSKYLLALAVSAVLAEATEYPSYDKGMDGKDNKYSHEVSHTTARYDGNKYGYGEEEYENNKHHDKTKTHHEHTKTHEEYSKATEKDSSYSKHDDKHKDHGHHGYHNSTSTKEYNGEHNTQGSYLDYKTYTKTETVTSTIEHYYGGEYTTTEYHVYTQTVTETSTITHIYNSYYTTTAAAYSEESPYIITETAAYSESGYVVTDTVVYSSPPETEVYVSSQEYTPAAETYAAETYAAETYAAETYAAAVTTPAPYYSVPSTMVTYAPYLASSYAPSAGVASTSLAVFTGSAGRQSVDYLLVAGLSALVGLVMWV